MAQIGREVLGSAVLEITADKSGLDTGLSSAAKDVDAFGRNARTAGAGIAVIGAAISGIALIATTTFASFEQSMARVQAVSGATAEQFRSMGALAKEMGRTTVFTANQSAEALAYMSMAGLTATQSMIALPDVLNLAAAGAIDLGRSADIVTNVMMGYGIAADDVTLATDILVATFTNANTNLEQLGTAFIYAGPVARAAGLEFAEVSAALGLMGNAGFQSTLAGTALRGAITRLLTPTKVAQEILDEMGVSIFDLEGNMLPLVEIIGQFEEANLTAADAMELFGQRAGPGMLSLIGQGSDRLEVFTQALRDSGGTADRIAKVQLDTLKGAFILLTSVTEGLGLAIGEKLAPHLRPLIESAVEIVQGITHWADRLGILVPAIAGFGVALVGLGGGLTAVGLLVPPLIAGFELIKVAVAGLNTAFIAFRFTALTAWAAAALPAVALGAIIAAALGFIALVIYAYWGEIREFFTATWTDIANTAMSAWAGIGTIISDAIKAVSEWLVGAWETIGLIHETAWTSIHTFLVAQWNAIGVSLSTAMQHITKFFSDAWQFVTDKILHPVGQKFGAFFDKVLEFAGEFMKKFYGIRAFMITLWNGIVGIIENAINAIIDRVNPMITWVQDKLEAAGINFLGTDGLAKVELGRIDVSKSVTGQAAAAGYSFLADALKGIAGTVGNIGSSIKWAGDEFTNAVSTVAEGQKNKFVNLMKAHEEAFKVVGGLTIQGFEGLLGKINTLSDSYEEAAQAFRTRILDEAIPTLQTEIRKILDPSYITDTGGIDSESIFAQRSGFLAGLTPDPTLAPEGFGPNLGVRPEDYLLPTYPSSDAYDYLGVWTHQPEYTMPNFYDPRNPFGMEDYLNNAVDDIESGFTDYLNQTPTSIPTPDIGAIDTTWRPEPEEELGEPLKIPKVPTLPKLPKLPKPRRPGSRTPRVYARETRTVAGDIFNDMLKELKSIRAALDNLTRPIGISGVVGGGAGRAGGLTIIFEAPVFALDDFEERVRQAVVEGQRRGVQEAFI